MKPTVTFIDGALLGIAAILLPALITRPAG